MKIGIAATFGDSPYRDIEFLKSYAAGIEETGFNSLWAPEHVVFFPKYDSKYPYKADGKVPWKAEGKDRGGLYDPLLVLSVAACVTSRLRLGTTVLVVPERPALLAAKEIMTLDHISGGRFEFGAGLGWSAEEYAALGVTWERRGKRFDEYLEAMKVAWTEEFASYHGEFVNFDNVVLEPKPVTPGGPPILIGGNSKAALRRAAKLGDGWYGVWYGMEPLDPVLDDLHHHLEEAGRKPGEGFKVKVNVPMSADVTPEEVAWKIKESPRLGIDELVLGVPIRSKHLEKDIRFWADLVGVSG